MLLGGLLSSAGGVFAQTPAIEFLTGTSSAGEDVRGVHIPLLLSEASTSEIRVDFTLSGTAAPGVNYMEPLSQTVVFAPMQEVASIYIAVLDNDLGEADADLQVTLSNPINATLGAAASHTFTIADNDGGPGTNTIPTISFRRGRQSVKESIGAATVEGVLSDVHTVQVEVNVEEAGGSAENPADYTFTPTTLTWAPGVRVASIQVPIVDDNLNESNESFRLMLSSPINGELGAGTETMVSIVDNDTVLAGFQSSSSSVQEAAGSVDIPLHLSVPSSRELTITLSPGGTAELDVDYTLSSEQVVFPAGVTSRAVTVTLIDDDNVEETKTLTLTVRSSGIAFPAAQNVYSLSIESEDVIIPKVEFAEAFTALDESAGTAEAEPTQTVSVAMTIIDPGTATLDEDYELPQLSAEFAAGQTSAKLVFNILDDEIQEVEEYVEVAIGSVTNGKAGSFRKHKFWIRDNDQTLNGGLSLFKQAMPTRDPERFLTLIGPADTTVNVRGLAADSAGNIYVTDQGPSFGEGEGSFLFCPANGEGRCIRLIRDMTEPGDVELTPDQRGFVIALPQGIISRGTFGFSLLLKQNGKVVNNATVHLFTEEGERVQEADPDGYYHFLDLMGEEASDTVTISVNHRGKMSTFSGLQPGTGGNGNVFGHRIIELELQP